MKNLSLIGIALAMAAAGCKEPPKYQEVEQQMTFDITVHKKGNTLTFTSVEGTAWKELTYSCKAFPCEFILNDKGANSKIPTEVFAIDFNFSDKDVKMVPVNMPQKKGPAWEVLTYSCETKDCAFRLTEKGVAGL